MDITDKAMSRIICLLSILISITDAGTDQPIEEAEVLLWLGFTIQIMPHRMVKATDSTGEYTLSCWDVDVLNNYNAPLLSCFEEGDSGSLGGSDGGSGGCFIAAVCRTS
jgi:hypothetical protein